MIDRVTRYTSAVVIKGKSAEEIIKGFFKSWISLFGTPKHVLTDNGGEFLNFKFTNLCDTFSITHLNTAAYSPWQNGTVERHNAILGDMINKVKKDTGCSVEVAVCWSMQAKNAMMSVFGFSPTNWFLEIILKSLLYWMKILTYPI